MSHLLSLVFEDAKEGVRADKPSGQ